MSDIILSNIGNVVSNVVRYMNSGNFNEAIKLIEIMTERLEAVATEDTRNEYHVQMCINRLTVLTNVLIKRASQA